MRVAFLTTDNSMHINIKAKYFDGPNDYVSFFAVQSSRLECKITYRDNIHVTRLKYEKKSRIANVFSHTKKMMEIIRQQHIDIVHIIDMWYCGYAIVLSWYGVKVVLENNGSDVLLTSAVRNPFKACQYWIAYKCSKAVVQDSIVTQNAGIRLGAKKQNNKIIELGIDTNIFHLNIPKGKFRKKYAIPDDAKVIFSPRSHLPLYNIQEIVDIIDPITAKFPNTYFVFCSYYKNAEYMKKIVKARGNTLFLGCVDNENELPYIYNDSDIVISIPNSDSSPRSVYEAIACGCNVIVTELPWIRNKFKDGREIFTIPLHDKESLICIVENILSGIIQVDSNAAFDRVKKMLDYKISEKKLKKLYENILNNA